MAVSPGGGGVPAVPASVDMACLAQQTYQGGPVLRLDPRHLSHDDLKVSLSDLYLFCAVSVKFTVINLVRLNVIAVFLLLLFMILLCHHFDYAV